MGRMNIKEYYARQENSMLQKTLLGCVRVRITESHYKIDGSIALLHLEYLDMYGSTSPKFQCSL